jgi:hypothetical protein
MACSFKILFLSPQAKPHLNLFGKILDFSFIVRLQRDKQVAVFVALT